MSFVAREEEVINPLKERLRPLIIKEINCSLIVCLLTIASWFARSLALLGIQNTMCYLEKGIANVYLAARHEI